MLWGIFCGIVFILIGACAFFKPELIWRLTEQWKSYAADEPSDLYVFSTKLGGAIFAALGLAVMILPFVLE